MWIYLAGSALLCLLLLLYGCLTDLGGFCGPDVDAHAAVHHAPEVLRNAPGQQWGKPSIQPPRVSVLALPAFLPVLLYHLAPLLLLWQLGINRNIIPGRCCSDGSFSVPPLRLIRLLQSRRNRLANPACFFISHGFVC